MTLRDPSSTGESSPDESSPDQAPCCETTLDLDDDALATDVETLATLGNDTRYEALRRIAGADDPVCVCELEPVLGVSQGAVSQALSRLFSAGLVDRSKDGRWRYYTATDRAERILAVLDDTRGADE